MFLASYYQLQFLGDMLKKSPDAAAWIFGSPAFPDIRGFVYFYQLYDSVLLVAEVSGLPHNEGSCEGRVFGFHIHEGGTCTGNSEDPFADTGMQIQETFLTGDVRDGRASEQWVYIIAVKLR